MLIVRRTDYAQLKRATETEREWLKDYLTFERFSHATRRVKAKTFLLKSGKFPPGLLRLVRRAARREKVPVEVEDRRPTPTPPDLSRIFALADPLREDQIEAVIGGFEGGNGIIQYPTGAGKTHIACATAYCQPAVRWLYVVGNKTIAHKTLKTWEHLTGQKGGLVHGKREEWSRPFVVAVATTLRARLLRYRKQLARFGGLLWDEAHEIPAKTFARVSRFITSAYYRLGLSATPFDRSDARSIDLVAVIGDVVHQTSETELRHKGVIATVDIRMVQYDQPPAFFSSYQEAREHLIVRSTRRNDLVAQMIAAAPKPCIVFFKERPHGLKLLRLARAQGWSSEMVDQHASTQRRDEVISRVNDGSLDVVIASRVFYTGVDMPDLRSGANAAGGKSVLENLQKLGRGTRPGGSAKAGRFVYYEVLDRSPNGGRSAKWMADHATNRKKAYLERGHRVKVGPSPKGPWTAEQGVEKIRARRRSRVRDEISAT